MALSMPNDHVDQLRRLRVLQSLNSVAPDPMGEIAILNAVRVDPELSPTLERVRQSLNVLHCSGLVELITLDDTDWLAGRISGVGKTFLDSEFPVDGFDLYHPSELPDIAPERVRGGRVSSVKRLPSETKAWLDQELVRRHFTGYVDLAELLEEQGYEISKSALGRYGKKFKEQQESLKQSIEMAKAFAEVVGDDGAAMNKTLTALAQQELMAIVREGRYDDSIKLPALVQAIAQLNRSDINTRKFNIIQEARHQALDDAANAVETAAQQQGLSADQAQFWREQVLGVK